MKTFINILIILFFITNKSSGILKFGSEVIMIGDCYLFDYDSPYASIANPANLAVINLNPLNKEFLLEDITINDYNDISGFEEKIPDPLSMAYNPKEFIPQYNIKLFGPSVNLHFGISSFFFDFINVTLDSYKGIFAGVDIFVPQSVIDSVNMMTFNIFNLNTNNFFPFVKDLFKFLTFYQFNIESLFYTNTNNISNVVNNYYKLIDDIDPTIAINIDLHLLSLYLPKFSITTYFNFDQKFGFYGTNDRIFFLIPNPALNLNMEFGSAFSFAFNTVKLPLFGYSDLGFTIRPSFKIKAYIEGIFDVINGVNIFTNYITTVYKEIFTNKNLFSIFNTEKFDGKIFNSAYSVSIDSALNKQINENLFISLKISDLFGINYWQNSKEVEWILPDASFGLRYTLYFDKWLRWLIDKPSLYFQIDDLFYTHPISLLGKLHLGADVRLLFESIRLGIGLNQGYPVAGISFDLSLKNFHTKGNSIIDTFYLITFPISCLHIKMSAITYGYELGRTPGEYGIGGYNLNMQLFYEF